MDLNGTSISRRHAAALVFASLTAACAVRPDPEPVWSFQSGAITVRYTADPMLNSRNGAAHTLVMTVYQLTSREAFDTLAKSEDGVRQLLEAQRFDPSVAGLERRIVQPGERNTMVLSRAEGARWVGIVLGYYSLDPEQAVRIFGIGHAVETNGRFRRRRTARVLPLTIELSLGSGTVNTTGAL